MIEIDGSQYSGSGTIVRQAVAFSALTGQPVPIINARMRRPKPGLRHQHVRVIEAIRDLVNGRAEGLTVGSGEVLFRPGVLETGRHYRWDIGTAGSTTMLALAILPVLAFASSPVQVELRGGLFQDFAPSFFHLQHVIVPMVGRMGFGAEIAMERPGYVPRGEGILRLTLTPVQTAFHSLQLDHPGPLQRIWGIALSSHLEERRVSERMAEAAQSVFARGGYRAEVELRSEKEALQPGAALAMFADLEGGIRLGADRAGALRRSAEAIGKYVARQLLEELDSRSTADRFAADQIVPFAALAEGRSRFRIPFVTEHLQSCAWLAEMFLGAKVQLDERMLTIEGVGYRRARAHVRQEG